MLGRTIEIDPSGDGFRYPCLKGGRTPFLYLVQPVYYYNNARDGGSSERCVYCVTFELEPSFAPMAESAAYASEWWIITGAFTSKKDDKKKEKALGISFRLMLTALVMPLKWFGICSDDEKCKICANMSSPRNINISPIFSLHAGL